MAVTVEFKDNAEEVLDKLETAVGQALFAMGAAAQGWTKDNTPVRTGELRDSWTVQIHEDESYLLLGTEKDYGKYVENGSPTNVPQHMLQKGTVEHKSDLEYIAKSKLKIHL